MHTKGPWEAKSMGREEWMLGVGPKYPKRGDEWRVESVPLSRPGKALNVAYLARGQQQPVPEVRANAALIAAAPDLLAAAKLALEAADMAAETAPTANSVVDWLRVGAALEAAIAKAEARNEV